MKKYGYLSVAIGFLAIGLPMALSSIAGSNPIQNYSEWAGLGEKLILGGECWGRSDYLVAPWLAIFPSGSFEF